MKNPLQLALNAVLIVAVAVLFYLHFSSAKAPKAATTAAPAAVVAADSTAAPVAEEEETVVTESADTAAAVATTAPAAPGEKIAYIESGRLLDGYQGMKDARRSFEAKAKGWERQNQALVTSFRAAVEAYQKQAPGMTAEQRAAAEEKLQAQQQESGMQQEKIARQAQEEEAKLTQTVLESVNKKVEAYGKANGYKLILIAAPSGTIAYGRKDMDITVPVLAYLNGQYRKR